MRTEPLPDGQPWWRLVDPGWADPLDAGYAAERGARWTPPGGAPTLYLNQDVPTARANLVRFLAGSSVTPDDLADTSFELVEVVLPDGQTAVDAHSPAGLAALGLPATYPLDPAGARIDHAVCQPIGAAVAAAGWDGVHARSAATAEGRGRELAWFPRGRTATVGGRHRFSRWYFPERAEDTGPAAPPPPRR